MFDRNPEEVPANGENLVIIYYWHCNWTYLGNFLMGSNYSLVMYV